MHSSGPSKIKNYLAWQLSSFPSKYIGFEPFISFLLQKENTEWVIKKSKSLRLIDVHNHVVFNELWKHWRQFNFL